MIHITPIAVNDIIGFKLGLYYTITSITGLGQPSDPFSMCTHNELFGCLLTFIVLPI